MQLIDPTGDNHPVQSYWGKLYNSIIEQRERSIGGRNDENLFLSGEKFSKKPRNLGKNLQPSIQRHRFDRS